MTTFRCEWCHRTLNTQKLFAYEGYENYNGAICKGCVQRLTDLPKGENKMTNRTTIKFYWEDDDGSSIYMIEVNSRQVNTVKRLLDEYRDSNDDYNIDSFYGILAKEIMGIVFFPTSADEDIYF